ncbi:ABC transporter permease [Nocardioides sp. InS609-2]|uniref:ABC transporter permease n=1 Tax=Nocardioides sp. InS609-2 TaxID=2760705 RepID=UPI0020BDA105|nr:ABC transporter permease [Nocardioides sp. InS609-2]
MAILTPVQATSLLVQRNYITYKASWKLFLTGFLEPVFYLLSIGIGVGALIDTFEFNGQVIPYAEFVAPGMLAASAFNGALIDSTYNVFFKLKYDKLYDQMLATPLSTSDIARGEIAWGQLRGGTYSAAFLLVMLAMDLISSWWAVLALPAVLLIGFAFSAVCMALTTWMKSWQDFDKITLAQLPLFLSRLRSSRSPRSRAGCSGSSSARRSTAVSCSAGSSPPAPSPGRARCRSATSS